MSTGTVLLPAAKDVRDMLAGLVGKHVAVSPGAPVTPTPDRPVVRGGLRRPGHGGQRALRHGPGCLGLHRRRAGPAAPRRLRRTRSRRTAS